MCLFIIVYYAAASIMCGVMYSVFVRRFASSSAARAQRDDDRFSKLLTTIINYYYKYFSLSLNAF